MRTIMSYPVAFLGAALMLSLSACTNQIISGVGSGPTGTGGGGGNTTGSVSSTTQSTSTGGPPLVPAVAVTRAQLDVLWDQYWDTHDPSSGVGTGGSVDPSLDPNDLFLHLSDLGVSCDSPTVELLCGLHYQVQIALPPAFQQVGVYDLNSPEIVHYSSMSEWGNPNPGDPTSCPWGGGTIGSGSLEILAIDATQVHFKVSVTNSTWDTNPSGEYIAPRCP